MTDATLPPTTGGPVSADEVSQTVSDLTTTTTEAADGSFGILDPMSNTTTMLILVSVGTALILTIGMLICFGVLCLMRRSRCFKKVNMDIDMVTTEESDPQKRYSTYSVTNAEIEQLKLTPITNNYNQQNKTEADTKYEKREETSPLMLSELPSPSDTQDRAIVGTDSINRYSWGQRNTSFRLATDEKEKVVQNLNVRMQPQPYSNRSSMQSSIDHPDSIQEDTPLVTPDKTKPTPNGQSIIPPHLATIHPASTSYKAANRRPHNLSMNRGNAIHYDVPRINPKPLTVVHIGKDSSEVKVPGLVMTDGGKTKPERADIKTPEFKPASTPPGSRPSSHRVSVESMDNARSSISSVPSVTSPKPVNILQSPASKPLAPWERGRQMSSPSTPSSPSGITASVPPMPPKKAKVPPPVAAKPKLVGKTMSLDGYMRQKPETTGNTSGARFRTTISEDSPSPLYSRVPTGQPRRIATVRPTSSLKNRSYNSFIEHLEQQYSQSEASPDSKASEPSTPIIIEEKTPNHSPTGKPEDKHT